MDNFNIYQDSQDMSDHEFTIHKQALQQDVKDYLEIDETMFWEVMDFYRDKSNVWEKEHGKWVMPYLPE